MVFSNRWRQGNAMLLPQSTRRTIVPRGEAPVRRRGEPQDRIPIRLAVDPARNRPHAKSRHRCFPIPSGYRFLASCGATRREGDALRRRRPVQNNCGRSARERPQFFKVDGVTRSDPLVLTTETAADGAVVEFDRQAGRRGCDDKGESDKNGFHGGSPFTGKGSCLPLIWLAVGLVEVGETFGHGGRG